MPAIDRVDKHHQASQRAAAIREILSPQDLGRLFWVGGSTCAGKTTVSTEVAKQLGWSVYHCDDHEENQRERADLARHPNWYSYSHITGDELWLQPVEQHRAIQDLACDEQLELIAEDLANALRDKTGPLIYDGYVSPLILAQLLPTESHAYFLVATEKFQREHYEQRPWIKRVLAKTSDPVRAWQNWMERDSSGARSLEKALRDGCLPWELVDGSVGLEETVGRICLRFRYGKAV